MRCRSGAAAGLIITAIGCSQQNPAVRQSEAQVQLAPKPPAALVEFERPSEPSQPRNDILGAIEYRRFMGLVSAELRARDVSATVGGDWVQISGGKSKTTTLGLRNLMQLCKSSPHEDWGSIISEHFENLLETMRQQGLVAQAMQDFERVRPCLVVRLYAAASVPAATREQLVTRTDLPGMVTVLMVDLPRAVESVPASTARAWHKSERELFAIALQNVRAHGGAEERQLETDSGHKFVVIEGADLVTSSHALLLKDHPRAIGQFGAIVAVPTRNRVVCLPVEDASVSKAAAEMAPLVARYRQAGPGATSDKLYWYHDGKFSEVETSVQDGNGIVRLPDELMQQLSAHPVKTASGREPGEQ